MAKSTKVTERQKTQVTDWRKEVAGDIEHERQMMSQLPESGGNFISWADGDISVGGVSQNPYECVILAVQPERAYYAGAYVPGSKEMPDCFSFDGIKPHENSSDPQCNSCAGCEQNTFGSALQGKGKACKEGTRISAVGGEDLSGSIYVSKKMAWSSAVIFKKFGASFAKMHPDYPLYAFPLQISNKPKQGQQYELGFVLGLEPLPSAEILSLRDRVPEARRLALLPYPVKEEEAPKAAPSGRKPRFQR